MLVKTAFILVHTAVLLLDLVLVVQVKRSTADKDSNRLNRPAGKALEIPGAARGVSRFFNNKKSVKHLFWKVLEVYTAVHVYGMG